MLSFNPDGDITELDYKIAPKTPTIVVKELERVIETGLGKRIDISIK